MDSRSGGSELGVANFTDEELKCYETWYSIIQDLSKKCPPDLSELGGEHGIPVFGMVTARFLKTSGVPKDVLHDIWQVVDVGNEGVLSLSEFGGACRLVSFYQHEKLLPSRRVVSRVPRRLAYFNISRFWSEAERPDGGEDASGVVDSYLADRSHISECLRRFWELSGEEDEFLDGPRVLGSCASSSLDRAELRRIWRFSDLDGDGRLSAAEFIIFSTLARVSAERGGLRVSSGVSRRSLLLVANGVIAMGRGGGSWASGAAQPTQPSSPEAVELSCEIARLSDEIRDFRQARDVLAGYKRNDDRRIIELNEEKLKLVAEHKGLLQQLGARHSEIAKNRDLIDYLYQDIKFLGEASGALSSALDLPKTTSTTTGAHATGGGGGGRPGRSVLPGETSRSRKHGNWVEFPSRDGRRPAEPGL